MADKASHDLVAAACSCAATTLIASLFWETSAALRLLLVYFVFHEISLPDKDQITFGFTVMQ